MTPHDATLPPTCADDAALEALVSGTLAPDRERALEAHLGGCAACRSRLDALAASPERWSTVREQLSAGAEADGEDAVPPIPALASLIQKILAPSDDEHMLGRLGPYEITGIIGSGGMGIVLKGHDRALDRFVAIKLLSPHLASSGAARQRFLREAKAAAAVVHDNVIAIHGVDEFAGLPYLVMPYCRGTTLEKRIRDAGPMNLREILRVGLQTARGLAAAHAQGLVHRDVKPANILLEDGVERVRITDFGLARAADDASLTVTGLLAGTPHYMSPEQALGKPLDARSDLFALGAVLFTLATGKPPFRAESSHAVLRMVTDVEPADVRLANPDMPAWLAAIIGRLLAKDPAARFSSATEVAGMLEACLAHVNDPLAIPLPPEVVRAAPAKPSPVAPAADRRTTPRTFLASLRRIMSDQRLLSIAALVIFLMALLLPWPIMALGRAEPAIVYAVIATLTSLLFAWLGRRDSLGRLVLKLAGTAAVVIIGVTGLSIAIRSTERVAAERDTALRAENLAKQAAKQAAMEAMMEANARQQSYPVTMVPMSIPVPNAPRVASGPDPMPVVGWPGDGASAEMPVLTATVPSSTPVAVAPSAEMFPSPQGDPPPGAILPPQAAPVFPTSPPPMGAVPRPNTPTVPGIDMALPAPGTMPPGGMGYGHPAGDATAELADSLDRLERWLAEHPHEAVAEITIRRPGALPDQQAITLGPDADIRSYVVQSLEDATTWQKEFTTGFLGRSLAALIRAGSFPVPPTGAGEAGVQMRLEEGDGFQQEVSISGDPKTGAVTTRERRVRYTTNGTFRTLNRTLCKDFREAAPGIWLPHRIDIDSFDIDPDKPENVIPKKACSVTVVVKEWQPAGGETPADGDAAPQPAETPALPASETQSAAAEATINDR